MMHATFSHFVQCFSTQQESCELRPDEVRGSSLLRTAVESRLDVLGEVEVEDDVLQRLVVASGIAVGGDELAPARRAHFALGLAGGVHGHAQLVNVLLGPLPGGLVLAFEQRARDHAGSRRTLYGPSVAVEEGVTCRRISAFEGKEAVDAAEGGIRDAERDDF